MINKTRGGKREGAGRPQGSGKYGEKTKAIRVPQSLVAEIQQSLMQYGQERVRLPFYTNKVPAGFPSPADDHQNTELDLNEYLIKNPATTFYVRVEGNSMLGAGIHPNDILIVDLSIEPRDGNIVIALLNGEFTVKRFHMTRNKQISLHPENDDYPTIMIKEGMDFRIWGVVTNVIHSLV